jgi:hypothetical protein
MPGLAKPEDYGVPIDDTLAAVDAVAIFAPP